MLVQAAIQSRPQRQFSLDSGTERNQGLTGTMLPC